MLQIDSIEYMVGRWSPLVERPDIDDSGAQIYSEGYRADIIDGFNALKAAINHEPDVEQGGAYEVDVTATGSVRWLEDLEEGAEIPVGDVAVCSLLWLSRYIGDVDWLNAIQGEFGETEAINDPEAFDAHFQAIAESTVYTGRPAMLRLPNAAYDYQGPPVLLVVDRRYGKPSTEVLGQLVCLASNEVSASRPEGSGGDPLAEDAQPPKLPPWNGNTLIPAGTKLDQPYIVPTDIVAGSTGRHHHEVYSGGAVLYPVPKSIPRMHE